MAIFRVTGNVEINLELDIAAEDAAEAEAEYKRLVYEGVGFSDAGAMQVEGVSAEGITDLTVWECTPVNGGA